MVNRRSMASATTTLAEIYRTEKDGDGFLYITYASQEMFGWHWRPVVQFTSFSVTDNFR